MRWMLFPPILKLLGRSTDHELAAQVQYLAAENRILRSRLPQRLSLTPAEKSLLVQLGAASRQHVNDLVAVCRPRTFLRWLAGGGKRGPRRAGGSGETAATRPTENKGASP